MQWYPRIIYETRQSVINAVKWPKNSSGITEQREVSFSFKNIIVFELEFKGIHRTSLLQLLVYDSMWITYLEIIESIRKKVTMWLLQLVDKGRGTVYPTVGPARGVHVWRSPGHQRARDCMPATDTRPQHTCLPLSALCLESLTLNPCHIKNLENTSSNTPQVWGHYWDMSSQGSRSEGTTKSGYHMVTVQMLSSEEWRPDKHRTSFPGMVHQSGWGGLPACSCPSADSCLLNGLYRSWTPLHFRVLADLQVAKHNIT